MRRRLPILVVAMGVLLAACGPASVDPTANPDTTADGYPRGCVGYQAYRGWWATVRPLSVG